MHKRPDVCSKQLLCFIAGDVRGGRIGVAEYRVLEDEDCRRGSLSPRAKRRLVVGLRPFCVLHLSNPPPQLFQLAYELRFCLTFVVHTRSISSLTSGNLRKRLQVGTGIDHSQNPPCCSTLQVVRALLPTP